jgi:hypothetical protein
MVIFLENFYMLLGDYICMNTRHYYGEKSTKHVYF